MPELHASALNLLLVAAKLISIIDLHTGINSHL